MEYSRPAGTLRVRTKHPSATGWIDKLYIAEHLDENQINILEEQFFRRIDQSTSNILDILRQGTTALTDEQRSDLSRFLMSLLHRHPEKIEELWQRSATQYHDTIDEVATDYLNTKRPNDPETFDEWKSLNEKQTIAGIFAGSIPSICNSAVIGGLLNGMPACVAEVAAPSSLLTSDRPFVLSGPLEGDEAVGTLPLTPSSVLLMASTPERLAQVADEARFGNFIDRINFATAAQAYRYVYSEEDTFGEIVELSLKVGMQ